jgi:formate dehydrogenase assembly factor FdhD
MMVSESRPTALAVETAKSLNMTLAFPSEQSDLIIVCGENRIVLE